MRVDLNATGQSVDLEVVNDTGAPVTNLVAATFPPVNYHHAGAGITGSLILSDILIGASWTDSGVIALGYGWYRVDMPNLPWTTAGRLQIYGYTSGKRIICPAIDVRAPDELMDVASGVETGLTFRKWLRRVASTQFGLTTNGQTKFRDQANTKNRIVATINSDGDRSALTFDDT